MTKNQKSHNIGITSNSVRFLLLSVALISLIIKTDFYDPFNSAKFLLLLILSSWILSHLINSYKVSHISMKSFEFKIVFIVLLFISSLLFSTFSSNNVFWGLIGETQRRNGLLAYTALSIIFLYTVRAINLSNVNGIYKTGILTGVIISSYGILQISGRDFVAWDNPHNSMISTLGNPNFASAFLAVVALIGIYGLFLKTLSRAFKILAFYLIATALFAILESGSRQGLFVIFFSTTFYLALYCYFKSKKVGTFITIIFIVIGLLVICGMLQKGPLTSLVYKQSVSVRGYYWRAGIEMFKSSPLTGVGIDRYGDYFKQFREASYALKYGFDITSNNAHNTFIQFFATAGFLTGVSYLVLIFTTIYSGIYLLKHCPTESRGVILGLFASWLGFQAQSLVSIDNIAISIWGWLLGGSILGLRAKHSSHISLKDNSVISNRASKKVEINLLQPVVFLLVLIPILFFSTSFYKAENNLYKLKGIANPATPENKEAVLFYAKQIIENSFSDPYYKYRSAIYLYDMGFTGESIKTVMDLTKKNSSNLDFLRGKLFIEEIKNNNLGIIAIREQISQLDPWNAENYLQLLKLYLANNELDKAKFIKDKILSFAPETEIAQSAKEMMD